MSLEEDLKRVVEQLTVTFRPIVESIAGAANTFLKEFKKSVILFCEQSNDPKLRRSAVIYKRTKSARIKQKHYNLMFLEFSNWHAQ
ncbi:hypothetical protein [Paenibacillus sp. MMO-58]|uniref:hypothetical protein n=1 Tax=Paenibacillus sp. MMO-58 TaxID=3081290 RepID=UPI003019BB1C